ncbi:gpr1/Fun34/Yaah family protein [Arthrobacter sp. Hiyo4]|nr:gpr1/Fun34/Yaah family protein [Arthrobacter sp. Hiyo4]
MFALIDLSLLATLLATLNASAAPGYVGGYLALAFAGVGSYLFVDACIHTTGGKGLPLGAPSNVDQPYFPKANIRQLHASKNARKL